MAGGGVLARPPRPLIDQLQQQVTKSEAAAGRHETRVADLTAAQPPAVFPSRLSKTFSFIFIVFHCVSIFPSFQLLHRFFVNPFLYIHGAPQMHKLAIFLANRVLCICHIISKSCPKDWLSRSIEIFFLTAS